MDLKKQISNVYKETNDSLNILEVMVEQADEGRKGLWAKATMAA